MISILGLCMLILYIPLVVLSFNTRKYRACKRAALIAAICVALFVNLGTAIRNISYPRFASYMYLLICAVGVLRRKRIRISKKVAKAAAILSGVMILGLLYLASPLDKPDVILMSTKIDNVYLGQATMQEAELTYSNFDALFDLMVFIVGLIVSKEFFSNKEDVCFILSKIRMAYCLFFMFATIEWLVNNFVSPTLIRNMVMEQRFIGRFDATKVYYPRNRFGFYGFSGLYSEESYVSMLLLFFCIFYVQGICNTKDFLQLIWGIAICIMSSCTTGLFIAVFPVVILLINLFKSLKSRISIRKGIIALITLSGLVVMFFITVMNGDAFLEIVDSAWKKMRAVFTGMSVVSNAELLSGTIRNFGNQVVLKAFLQSPILGVGIGTTRGYGILAGWLATFGVAGVFAYLNFVYKVIGVRLEGKYLLLLVIGAYFTTILSVFYVYTFMMIPYFLLFSYTLNTDHRGQSILIKINT